MKPTAPHDPLDDLIAAALHGELTPEERAQFDARLQNDPAAHAAYQEALIMHDMLDKNYHNAQPDPAFEQRMVSGVRRKIQHGKHRETAWESVLVLWAMVRAWSRRFHLVQVTGAVGVVALLVALVVLEMTSSVRGVFTTISDQLAYAGSSGGTEGANMASAGSTFGGNSTQNQFATSGQASGGLPDEPMAPINAPADAAPSEVENSPPPSTVDMSTTATAQAPAGGGSLDQLQRVEEQQKDAQAQAKSDNGQLGGINRDYFLRKVAKSTPDNTEAAGAGRAGAYSSDTDGIAPANSQAKGSPSSPASPSTTTAPAAVDTRKLIRNAELELEVKSYTDAMDQITALTKSAGGYVDTSNSQRGGNGKLQGTVVVKVLPENLDDFLLKLRDLGQIKNQSISTEDVTKDYYDTQARLNNSRQMETQLQDLLKHENSKVTDLLQVERELSRVRGEIEQDQGQLKLYDFEVQFATVTMQVSEKDMKEAAAYLLKEQDDFSLFSTDVEGAFQKARQTADDFKAQVLTADLNHNTPSDVSAELLVMVDPAQIEPFLAQIRMLGRVANFTRQTQRVAQDGGESDQPADQTLTERDKVQVHVTIRSDDESRKQVALTVVTPAVDDAFDRAKAAALAAAGTEILSSSLHKTQEGQSTAQISLRVPGNAYPALLNTLRALGRAASFSLQRDDDAGPGANGDDAPVILSLELTDDDEPLQETNLSVISTDVDDQSQQLKKDAAATGVEIKASSFSRQPDGTETAQLVFRLPMENYSAFIENLKKLGKVELFTVQRRDRPDQARSDETAPVEISLQLHNERDIVAADNGLWATLRGTFSDGADALFGSIRTIGFFLAFLAPWVFTLLVAAWIGRRIYLWSKK